MALTYSGYTSDIFLPRYYGADSKITLGTITAPEPSSISIETVTVSGTGIRAGSGNSSGGLSNNQKGAIAGGVIGGVAIVAGLGAVVWVLVRHMRKSRAIRDPQGGGQQVGVQQVRNKEFTDLGGETRTELDGQARAELEGRSRNVPRL